MSHSIVERQRIPSKAIPRQVRELKAYQQRSKTLQLQGNQSLGLGVLEGYFPITIPTTIEPSVAMFDVVAPTGTTILIGNLMYSIFYRLNVGGASPTGYIFDNRDVGDLYPTRLIWECFFAFDSRPKGSGLLPSIDDVLGTEVPFTTARITAKIRSNSNWSLPPGADAVAYIFFQVRATLM